MATSSRSAPAAARTSTTRSSSRTSRAACSIRDAERGYRIGPVRFGSGGSRRAWTSTCRGPRGSSARPCPATSRRTASADESRWSTASGDLHLVVEGGSADPGHDVRGRDRRVAGPIGIRARTVSGDLRLSAPRIEALQAVEHERRRPDRRATSARASSTTSRSVSGDVFLADLEPGPARDADDRGRRPGDRRPQRRGRRAAGGRSSSATGRCARRPGRRPATSASQGRGTAGIPPIPASGCPTAPRARAAPAHAEGSRRAAGARRPRSRPSRPSPRSRRRDASWVVAEAEAAPNLVRGRQRAGRRLVRCRAASVDRREAARLDILRALERGELDIEAASYRLAQLDEAGPRSFRGFC